ncbi:MAG: hypothetical protein ACAF48_00135 [Candidatus Carsonella ruddii]
MINKIIKIIKNKIKVSKSYSKYILLNNFEFLFKKIFEEMFEIYLSFNKYIIIKNCYNRYFLIKEICDLIYHLTIFIIYNNISYLEIEKEFIRRTNITGFEEKIFR